MLETLLGFLQQVAGCPAQVLLGDPSGLGTAREPGSLLEWAQPEHVAIALSRPTSTVHSLWARHHNKSWESGKDSCAPPILIWKGRAGSSRENRSWHQCVIRGLPFGLTFEPGGLPIHLPSSCRGADVLFHLTPYPFSRTADIQLY